MSEFDASVKPPDLEDRSANDSIWVLIPAYNECESLAATLESVCAQYPHVVVIDDGSTDGTAQIARQYPVWVLRHALNCGQGAALQTGFGFVLRQPPREVVVTFDADGQHCVEDIPSLTQPILQGEVDLCLGSRFLGKAEGIPWTRRLLLKLAVLFTRWTSGLKLTDTHNGLRAIRLEALREWKLTQRKMAHASEILELAARNKLRYREVPVTIKYTPESLRRGQRSWEALRILGQLLLGKLER
ncbi:Dolichol-phosphate mannosyltransferase in lipid-linked oligosaccharide synthesis cluster [Planctomycetales bacterium 10988]|nr:Dolichol-phosphate mannosyltransferase in lipid-linked oligosaccharide synthesis cluster [Planctomycetales bacterium 10988]